MRRQQQQQQTQSHTQLQFEQSDEENTNSSPSQILERVQSDRVAVTKPEEDRRRRTIIVEKRSGTFGFTLQSYGIHYKREQEIEMITYVDYVEYDGPAYRAGMRQGDVILSINGIDMEKADHKTLVSYIKSCDARMRMVVLFEDCVRKVELHMRYIQLQRVLQARMGELERLCLRERQLLEGKWKTHSLPARSKKSSQGKADTETASGGRTPSYAYCRPTVSTEDVAARPAISHRHHHHHNHHQQQQQQPPAASTQPALILAYQYLDPRYRYLLQPSTTSSGEYLLTFEQAQCEDGEPHHFLVKTPNGAKKKHAEHRYTGQLCNPCVQHASGSNNNSGDNTSLEAYDLASPCCDPHCVPSGRRRSRHKKRASKSEETQTEVAQPPRARPHSTSSQPRRYVQVGSGLVNQCSLSQSSCTGSQFSCIVPTTTGETTSSYSTSLSTDTLYWDGSEANSSTSMSKVGKAPYPATHTEPAYAQCAPGKPKSWDNLASKAVCFGYACPSKGKSNALQYPRGRSVDKHVCQQTNKVVYATMTPPHHVQRRYVHTKSTESLLSGPASGKYEASESSSNECLNGPVAYPNADARFLHSPRASVVSPSDSNCGYYSTRRGQTCSRNIVSTSSQATRL